MRAWFGRIKAYRATPAQILITGFALAILVGAALLSLPFASATGEPLRLVDAIFTSTSAICVTGLIVKDTPADFSLFGQIVILVLIQVGGLGYATSATLIFLLLGKRVSIRESLVMKEASDALDPDHYDRTGAGRRGHSVDPFFPLS